MTPDGGMQRLINGSCTEREGNVCGLLIHRAAARGRSAVEAQAGSARGPSRSQQIHAHTNTTQPA